MKVLTQPKVTVVGKTTFQEHPTYELPEDGTDVERLGAFAAKGCYDSYGKDGRECIDNQRQILEHRHGSVLEHSYVSCFLEGITRALTLELNRHRLFNISQRSTRYTKEEDSCIVLEPYYADIWHRNGMSWDEDAGVPLLNGQNVFIAYVEEEASDEVKMVADFVMSCADAVGEYSNQVETLIELNPAGLKGFDLRKWARGKARNVLPHALETRGTWTMNMRAWRWFIELRSSRHAEPEIRRLAEHVLAQLKPIAPTYFEDFNLAGIVDNIPEYVPKYHKV